MFRGLLLLVLGSVTWVNKILRLPQLPRMFVPSFAYGAWLATPSRCARPWWWWWWWLGNSLWLEDLDDLIEAVNMVWNYVLAGGNSKICLFSPLSLGKWSHLTHTFQRGWNHQPVIKYGGGVHFTNNPKGRFAGAPTIYEWQFEKLHKITFNSKQPRCFYGYSQPFPKVKIWFIIQLKQPFFETSWMFSGCFGRVSFGWFFQVGSTRRC